MMPYQGSLNAKSIEETVRKLCGASRKDYANPYSLQWPDTLDSNQWFVSPELISICGTATYDSLDEEEKKRLSFYEAVNFFSLNIHGEKILVEGLTKRLYTKNSAEITPYLHHFLDEENKHMIYFGEFCMRYAGKIYRDKKVPVQREYTEGEQDFLFFAQVLIFEEIVDTYNIRMSRDSRLEPLARRINFLHHKDEARHLVFGRKLVADLFGKYVDFWSPETIRRIRQQLGSFLTGMWKEYHNPDVYRDAGMEKPYEFYEESLDCSRTRREEISQSCIQYLIGENILEKAPSV